MKKIRLTMKLLLFFSLALVLNTSAIPSKAQQTKVSLNLKDKQLEDYRQEEAREQQEIISEHVSGSFVRNGVSYR